jgi:hypothetical protein
MEHLHKLQLREQLKIAVSFLNTTHSIFRMRVSYENKAQSRNVSQLQIHPVDVCVYHIFASFYEELIAKRAEYSGEV